MWRNKTKLGRDSEIPASSNWWLCIYLLLMSREMQFSDRDHLESFFGWAGKVRKCWFCFYGAKINDSVF